MTDSKFQPPKVFAYLQYVNRDSLHGALIRVLPGFFVKRPENFSSIVLQQEQFFTFFLVSAAVNRGIVTIMANEAIPESARKMPVLRTPGGIDKRGKILNWWILDGESKQLVSELSAEQKNLSIASVMNDTMLVHRIVEGWSPSDWV